MSDKSKRPSNPADAMLRCSHCDRPYREHGCDLTLPDEQWETVFGNTGGVLCGTCICKRAAQLPGAVAIRAHIEFATPAHAQRQDAQPAAPSAQERDARRYRTLRDSALEVSWNQQVSFSPGYNESDAEAMDRTIDRIIREEPQFAPPTQPAGAAVEAVDVCGTCGTQIRPDPLTGTTCSCATQQRSGQDGVDDAVRALISKWTARIEMDPSSPYYEGRSEMLAECVDDLEAALANPPAPAPEEGAS